MVNNLKFSNFFNQLILSIHTHTHTVLNVLMIKCQKYLKKKMKKCSRNSNHHQQQSTQELYGKSKKKNVSSMTYLP